MSEMNGKGETESQREDMSNESSEEQRLKGRIYTDIINVELEYDINLDGESLKEIEDIFLKAFRAQRGA